MTELNNSKYVELLLEDKEKSEESYLAFVMDMENYLEYDDSDLYGDY